MSSFDFDHAEHGEIQFNNGSTSFADFFAIGAVSLTSKQVYEKGKFYKKYASDREGLEMISMKSGECTTFLHDSIHCVGVLLAQADANEIQSEIPYLAWLIAGMGELAEIIAMAQSEIDFALTQSSDTKKPR